MHELFESKAERCRAHLFGVQRSANLKILEQNSKN